MSFDGSTVVANIQDNFQDGRVVSYFDRLHPYVFAIQRNGTAVAMLSTAEISVDTNSIAIEGASNSELQS